MINRLDEKEVSDFLENFQNNQIDQKNVLDFLIKLINRYYMLEKEYMNEVENLKKMLNIINSESSTLLINSIKKQEFLNILYSELKDLKNHEKGINFIQLTKLESKILNFSLYTDDSWEYLFNHFLVKQNIDLKKTLSHFDLSDAEFKVCALTYLEFSTKSIAKILNLSSRSIDSQKYRIRKKLGISRNDCFIDFVNEILKANR